MYHLALAAREQTQPQYTGTHGTLLCCGWCVSSEQCPVRGGVQRVARGIVYTLARVSVLYSTCSVWASCSA